MTEIIVRLTPEQEDLFRKPRSEWEVPEWRLFEVTCRALGNQARDAIALYDQLVAEAKAKSDD